MNENYPVWWDTPITVFNKFIDKETDVITWKKHVVNGCFWKHNVDRVAINQTVIESSSIICRIPKQDNFLEKYQWVEQPNDDMESYFTLGVGDIIVKGNVDDDVNEYEKGHRSNDLIAKYKELQGCIQIQEVHINVGPGRCLPHYYVKGE